MNRRSDEDDRVRVGVGIGRVRGGAGRAGAGCGGSRRVSRRYAVAVMRKVETQWTRPDLVAVGQHCTVAVEQLPGGQVVDMAIRPGCQYDLDGQRSVERAVRKASPLPYAGFESVFNECGCC